MFFLGAMFHFMILGVFHYDCKCVPVYDLKFIQLYLFRCVHCDNLFIIFYVTSSVFDRFGHSGAVSAECGSDTARCHLVAAHSHQ